MSRYITMPAVATALLLSACGASDTKDSASSAKTSTQPDCPFNASGTIRALNPETGTGLIRGNAKINRIPFIMSRDVVEGKPRVGARVVFFYDKGKDGPAATCVRVSRLDG